MGEKREEWSGYIHGYGEHESRRLSAQAGSVVDLLHDDTRYPPGSRVLEVGCGTGEQTIRLARTSPAAYFVSLDRSGPSLAQARERVVEAGLTNVELLQADRSRCPFRRSRSITCSSASCSNTCRTRSRHCAC